MRELPIIMGADSVRAMLDGRKTQTRRVVNKKALDRFKFSPSGELLGSFNESHPEWVIYPTVDDAPYRVGDRLWVKETWGVVSHTFDENENICDWKPNRPAKPIRELKFGTGYYDGHVIYKADGGFEWNAGDDCSIETKIAWKSPLFMPRWASRITLEITDIRVGMVQDITPEDALKEGFCNYGTDVDTLDAFCEAWQKLNAKRGYPWEKTPWVWVVTFKEAPHD